MPTSDLGILAAARPLGCGFAVIAGGVAVRRVVAIEEDVTLVRPAFLKYKDEDPRLYEFSEDTIVNITPPEE